MATRADLDHQRFVVACDKRRRHDEWVQQQQDVTKATRSVNKARLLMLVDEAYRVEKLHLYHQLEYCKRLLGLLPNDDIAPSPSQRQQCAQPPHGCPCTRSFTASQLQPRYRALHLLMAEFPSRNVDGSFEAVRQSYRSDDEMLVDLIERYGPEDNNKINVRVWFANARDRMGNLSARWAAIRRKVSQEMSHRDNSATVIRSLSVMRIFVDGSQSEQYGVDTMDRGRRDAMHQFLLDELIGRNSLFTA